MLLFTESPRPARVRRHPLAPWLVVATVSIGAFMGQLDASIVTLALPRIGRAFSVGPGVAVWVSLSYLLALVCALPVSGHLADRFGRKRLYVQGFAVFALASAACGLAPDLPALVLARVVQGAGAALLQANSVALIRETLEPRDLGRGIGIQGAAQALGLALGPAAGGLLLALGDWRLLFLVNVPAGAAGVLAGVLLLPRSVTLLRGRRFDTVGALLLPLAIAPPLVALTLAHRWGAPASIAIAAGGLAVGVALVAVERRAGAPLLDLALLRRRPFPSALASGALAQTALFGALVALPFALAARGIGSVAIGLELAALPIALGICAPFAGRLGARASAGGLALAGAALMALAFADTTAARLAMLALAGAGLGAFVPANNASVMRAAPAGRAAEIGGVLNMTRAIGTALGVALAGLLYGLDATLLPLGGAALLGGLALASRR